MKSSGSVLSFLLFLYCWFTFPFSNHRSRRSNSLFVLGWNWNPNDVHPCNIRRYTYSEFEKHFGSRGLPSLYHEPIIILNSTKRRHDENSASSKKEGGNHMNYANNNNEHEDDMEYQKKIYFQYLTDQKNIIELFGTNFTVTLTSSNAYSEHKKILTLEQYIIETTIKNTETLPNQLSNETWYLFGETYEKEWYQLLLQHYVVPKCYTCHNYNESQYHTNHPVSLAFGIGNRGSGVQWHTHGPGFSEAIHGRKHWVLYPPSQESPIQFHKDQSSRQWMEYVYTNLSAQTRSTAKKTKKKIIKQKIDSMGTPSSSLLYECTIDPGDVIYFPTHWWHATINLDPYTVFVSTFTTEHTLSNEDNHYDEKNKEQQQSIILDNEL